MERFDLNAAKESETTKVQAGVVIDACKEYMRSAGSSWTVSSKVIKALVHAMELELTDFMGKE